MSWMDGQLDKAQNKYKCACGEPSVHGLYDDDNKHIGEFCDSCLAIYLEQKKIEDKTEVSK